MLAAIPAFGRMLRLAACLLPSILMLVLTPTEARSESCPTATDEINTDRPDVTNSSVVVPWGSLQNENGLNLSAFDGGRTFDGTNSRWRLGVAPCLEVLVDLPNYYFNARSPGLPVGNLTAQPALAHR
jgi:hypothetical protein